MPRFRGARSRRIGKFGPYSKASGAAQTRPAVRFMRARCGESRKLRESSSVMRFANLRKRRDRDQLRGVRQPEHPLVICLHGFPEYWAAWSAVMLELCRFLSCRGARPARLQPVVPGRKASRPTGPGIWCGDLARSPTICRRSVPSSWPATIGAPRSPMPMPSRIPSG